MPEVRHHPRTEGESKPGWRLNPCLTDWRFSLPPLPETTLIPRIETPDDLLFF